MPRFAVIDRCLGRRGGGFMGPGQNARARRKIGHCPERFSTVDGVRPIQANERYATKSYIWTQLDPCQVYVTPESCVRLTGIRAVYT